MATKTIEFTETATLVTLNCAHCGVLYAMPTSLNQELRKGARTFFCPIGHSQWYGESAADKATKRADEAELEATRLRAENDQAWARVSEERKARTAAEREATRIQKRADAGVCQHCRRTFADVGRHMANKHAEPAEKKAAGKAERATRVKP